jgi:hypothetical protein
MHVSFSIATKKSNLVLQMLPHSRLKLHVWLKNFEEKECNNAFWFTHARGCVCACMHEPEIIYAYICMCLHKWWWWLSRQTEKFFTSFMYVPGLWSCFRYFLGLKCFFCFGVVENYILMYNYYSFFCHFIVCYSEYRLIPWLIYGDNII